MSKPLISAIVLLCLGACASNPEPTTAANPVDLETCRRLAANFDRYSSRGEGQSSIGTLDRQTGEQLCQQGRTAEGIERLRRANAARGFIL